MTPPAPQRLRKALSDGNPPYNLPEDILSQAMAEHKLSRIDFLGEEPGLWSLHPRYRSDLFYRELPRLIQRVETGDVPQEQRGDYDVNDSMIHGSDVRARMERSRRRQLLGRFLHAILRRG